MKTLIQRVAEANVDIAGESVGQVGRGLLILFCAETGDTPERADKMADKISKLRIFEDDAGKMNLSVLDAGGAALVVSQFTLAADLSRGNRPGFSGAARPDEAVPLLERFIARLRDCGLAVEIGRFGADMQVHLVNDGPVTIWIDEPPVA